MLPCARESILWNTSFSFLCVSLSSVFPESPTLTFSRLQSAPVPPKTLRCLSHTALVPGNHGTHEPHLFLCMSLALKHRFSPTPPLPPANWQSQSPVWKRKLLELRFGALVGKRPSFSVILTKLIKQFFSCPIFSREEAWGCHVGRLLRIVGFLSGPIP